MKFVLTIPLALSLSLSAFAQTTNPAPYCLPKFKNAAVMTDYIDTVNYKTGDFSFRDVLNKTTLFNNSSYVYYNNLQPMIITKGYLNQIKMHGYSSMNASVILWIDTNRDNNFQATYEEFDSYEADVNGGMWDGGLFFTLPDNMDTGLTRMRIALYSYGSTVSLNPCPTGLSNSSSPEYGEVEDYNIRVIADPTSISELAAKTQVNIYPNPAKGKVHIAMPTLTNSKDITVIVTDLMGRVVINQPMPVDNTISVVHLAPSIYQVQVLKNGELVTRTKLVVQ